MKLKPHDKRIPVCSGMRYASFCKILVSVNALHYIVAIAIDIYEIVQIAEAVNQNPPEDNTLLSLRSVAYTWFLSLHVIFPFLMDIRLLKQCDSPSIKFLRLYWILPCVTLPIFLAYVASLIIYSELSPVKYPVISQVPVRCIMLLLGHWAYRIITGYVLRQYIRDIRSDRQLKSRNRNLTTDEVLEFECGGSKASSLFDENLVWKRPYLREKWEIGKERIDFGDAVTLGCGEYGCVFKARLRINGESIFVAVKTTDPSMNDVVKFKTLLDEAKLMTFIGKHENVVELIGICTSDIIERKLYIVCELCEFGNLRAHLRSKRNTFVNLFPGTSGYSGSHKPEVEKDDPVTSLDLVKWAYQIASGMEFLANSKIVHGDLALRNVLLTSTKTAKITDFGLSRRLYNYSVYQKRNNVPLPWRWLALECLVDMNFSTKSDVWSFGICCWEMFELGARPWPEFSEYTLDFVNCLRNEGHPKKPKLCNDSMYNFMCSFWKVDAKERPTFTELKEYFLKI